MKENDLLSRPADRLFIREIRGGWNLGCFPLKSLDFEMSQCMYRSRTKGLSGESLLDISTNTLPFRKFQPG